MGNKVISNPQRRPNDPNDGLGVVRTIDDACVFLGSEGPAQAASLIPDNGEYEWAGSTGNCAVCSTCAPRRMERSDGSCDDAGRCGWSGAIPQYRRRAYLAPADRCCETSSDMIENRTCDPKYRGGAESPDCDDYFRRTCTGQNIFTDDKCMRWAERVGAGADGLLNTACTGNNLEKTLCRNWCDRNLSQCVNNFRNYCTNPSQFAAGSYCAEQSLREGFEVVDTPVNSFCNEHLDESFCACIKFLRQTPPPGASDDLKRVLSRPECYDAQCASGTAYKTLAMRQNLRTGACPNISLCRNEINILDTNNSKISELRQGCGTPNDEKTEETHAGGTPVVQQPAAPALPIEKNDVQLLFDYLGMGDLSSDLQYLILLFIFIVIVSALVSLFDDGDDKQEDKKIEQIF